MVKTLSMQKITLLLLLLQPMWLLAQEYKFSARSSAYSHFDDGAPVESDRYIKLPFQLTADTIYDSLYVRTSGISKDHFIGSDLELNLCFAIASHSNISYKVEGDEGSRIVKIQFESIKFLTDTTEMDSTEGQVWLYEGSNTLELHYGTSVINNDKTYGLNFFTNEYDEGFLCGLRARRNKYYLKGSPGSPGIQGDLEFTSLIGDPTEGQVYKFELLPNSLRDELPFGMVAYPNPSNGVLNIQSTQDFVVSSARLSILSVAGQQVFTAALQPQTTNQTFDLSNLPAGMYLIEVAAGSQMGYSRLMISK